MFRNIFEDLLRIPRSEDRDELLVFSAESRGLTKAQIAEDFANSSPKALVGVRSLKEDGSPYLKRVAYKDLPDDAVLHATAMTSGMRYISAFRMPK